MLDNLVARHISTECIPFTKPLPLAKRRLAPALAQCVQMTLEK